MNALSKLLAAFVAWQITSSALRAVTITYVGADRTVSTGATAATPTGSTSASDSKSGSAFLPFNGVSLSQATWPSGIDPDNASTATGTATQNASLLQSGIILSSNVSAGSRTPLSFTLGEAGATANSIFGISFSVSDAVPFTLAFNEGHTNSPNVTALAAFSLSGTSSGNLANGQSTFPVSGVFTPGQTYTVSLTQFVATSLPDPMGQFASSGAQMQLTLEAVTVPEHGSGLFSFALALACLAGVQWHRRRR